MIETKTIMMSTTFAKVIKAVIGGIADMMTMTEIGEMVRKEATIAGTITHLLMTVADGITE